MSLRKVRFAIAFSILLAACGQSISGTYWDKSGSTLVFESGGKLYMKTWGITQELKYEVDGKTIKVILPGGVNTILAMNNDGSLDGWMGGKLVKK